MAPRRKISGGLAALGGLAILAVAGGAGQPKGNPDYGFVLTRLTPAFYRGDEKIDCPEGRSLSLREAFLASQTAAERERLLKPENSVELERRYKNDYVFHAGGRDMCTSPAEFDKPDVPLEKTAKSSVGPGLDLDGAAADGRPAPGTCAHQSFVSPAGEPGVDNQFFRAVACNTFWRGTLSGGTGDAVRDNPLATASAVMIVRGVQSWEDSPHVQVVIAASPDVLPADVHQQVVAGGSLSMTDNPRWRAVLAGRIEKGVLTTEPADLVLPTNWVGATHGELIIRRARLRVALKPDGDVAGLAGGYRPIDNLIGRFEVGGPGVASVAGLDCASLRRTLRLLADGDPDPKSGACTTVSEGFDIEGKPAFVFDHGALAGVPRGGARLAAR